MDSKLLAGAYSKRYKYIEREHIEALKVESDIHGTDVIARARRLSQETNKRRKLLAQKRKQEAVREEKRRQEILNKRHQEQKQATEKYQRCHVGSRPRTPPRRQGHSPTRSHVELEDALRLIGSGTASSNISGQSREAIQRLYGLQHSDKDSLRASRASSANQRESRRSHKRPLSGCPLNSSLRSQLMERSMRNLTSSRSRFEQQLEQHQQLLVEQQHKSLRDFNKAIRKEIDADSKVQGMEEMEEGDVPERSESLSSLDSLEDGGQSSQGNSFSGSQLAEQFRAMTDIQMNEHQTIIDNDQGDNAHTQHTKVPGGQPDYSALEQLGGPHSVKAAARGFYDSQKQPSGQNHADTGTVLAAGTDHIVGPIPQGYYTTPAGILPSSTPVIQGNLSYYADSLDTSHSGPEKRVTVGTALRLPQQSPQIIQPVKQPAPVLQYDSRLLANRRFEAHANQGVHGTVLRKHGGSSDCINQGQQDMDRKQPVIEQPTSALTQNELPEERPKAHVYAWSSPPPEEIDGISHGQPNSQGQPNTYGQSNVSGQPSATGSNYSASMVADRVMATNLHPHTCRTISTAATTTWVCQSVNSTHTKEPTYSQASINSNGSAAPQTGYSSQSPHTEIPKGQGQKPGSVLTSVGTYPSGLQFTATLPPSYQNKMQASDHRVTGFQSQQQSGTGSGTGTGISEAGQQKHKGGSISQGTLGLINGRLTTITVDQQNGHQPHQNNITVVEDDTESKKEVRSILKKASNEPQSKLKAGGQVKFNVHDSVEIAKKHLKNEQVKRKKVQKKGVRFADLHYPDDVEEDTDSADSLIDSSAATANINSSASTQNNSTPGDMKSGRPFQRARPASARVTPSAGKTADLRHKVPRVASAGPARHPPASRPKAAAHIIMSGDNSLHSNHHIGEPSAGITVHKSQLDKKVMLINNNFMSRVPVYSSAAFTSAPASTASVYTVSGSRNAAASSTADGGCNGEVKPSVYSGGAGEAGKGVRGKGSVPALSTATVLPSHSHFTNANNTYKAVYNENGMRIDRTPTDDEINNLWKNMRSMLDVSDGKATQASSSNPPEAAGRPQVQVSHQYIDGASLFIPNGITRVVGPGHAINKGSSQVVSGMQPGLSKASSSQATKNGYSQRYSLLQQRRNPGSVLGASARTNGVVEQTLQPVQLTANESDPWQATVNISYAPREEMSESMAGFLAAEQAVQTQGADVRESRVVAAMESAQRQQEMYNSVRQKVARGGPSALSMEEHRLLESLDKLNERLKSVESRQNNGQQTVNYPTNPSSQQVYVHGSGFRGHQVIRRQAGGGRPVSARLLARPYH